MPHRDPNKLYWHDHIMKYVIIPFVPRWVTPNHVTVVRFLLTPFVVWALAALPLQWAIPFFLLVAFTDVIDGSLARLRHQVTEWGSMYDPIADKILISLAAVIVITSTIGWWLTILVIFSELMVVVGALSHKHDGGTIMANGWGKTKMFTQVLGVTLLLFSMLFHLPVLVFIGMVVLCLSLVLAMISVATYGA